MNHVLPAADGWTVVIPYGDVDLVYGPYRTEADALAVWQRLAAQFRREGQILATAPDAPVAHGDVPGGQLTFFQEDWD